MGLAEAHDATERALTYPEQARALAITDAGTYERACQFLLGIKALRTQIEETFAAHVKRAFEAHRALVAECRDAQAPLADAERIVKDSLVTYDQERERLQREEQRQQLASQRAHEEERRLQEALALEARGRGEEAEAALMRPIIVPVPAADTREVPKVAGISYRESWKFAIEDESLIPREFLKVDETKIGRVVRAMGAQTNIPGVRIWKDRDIAASGRR